MGSICGDSFHRAFQEFALCNFKKDDLCQVEPFVCPACTPDMLAISADGNRKHYRYKKSKGLVESLSHFSNWSIDYTGPHCQYI